MPQNHKCFLVVLLFSLARSLRGILVNSRFLFNVAAEFSNLPINGIVRSWEVRTRRDDKTLKRPSLKFYLSIMVSSTLIPNCIPGSRARLFRWCTQCCANFLQRNEWILHEALKKTGHFSGYYLLLIIHRNYVIRIIQDQFLFNLRTQLPLQ